MVSVFHELINIIIKVFIILLYIIDSLKHSYKGSSFSLDRAPKHFILLHIFLKIGKMENIFFYTHYKHASLLNNFQRYLSWKFW